MKKIISIIILIIISFLFNFNINALSYGGCEYSQISKLRTFISNVNLSFDYYIKDNEAYFNITLSNLVPDIYFTHSITGTMYSYYDSYDGEITIRDIKYTNGHFKFYSALQECYGVKLNNKYYKLPTYNDYYSDPLCEQNKNYSLCQKWATVNYSYNEFKNLINEYNKQNEFDENIEDVLVVYEQTILDKIVKFYTDYYYIILISIIVVCVIAMIINRRKNSFDL